MEKFDNLFSSIAAVAVTLIQSNQKSSLLTLASLRHKAFILQSE
ncbi:hypothetical protein Q3A68_04740 [Mucilaginibacter sp. BT774]|nr:hypothetical protein [Mucilaginibacter sp. BT774]